MGKQKTMTLYERAFEDGREEGEFKTKLDTALKLHTKGFTVSEILEITGLSEDQLRENGILLGDFCTSLQFVCTAIFIRINRLSMLMERSIERGKFIFISICLLTILPLLHFVALPRS